MPAQNFLINKTLCNLLKIHYTHLQMLVVFKSAPILKRTLKVKHAMLQVISLSLSVKTFSKCCLSAVCAEIAEDADKVPWQAVEKIKHEDNERHLYQGLLQKLHLSIYLSNFSIICCCQSFVSRYGTGSTMTGPLAMTWTPDHGISRQA